MFCGLPYRITYPIQEYQNDRTLSIFMVEQHPLFLLLINWSARTTSALITHIFIILFSAIVTQQTDIYKHVHIGEHTHNILAQWNNASYIIIAKNTRKKMRPFRHSLAQIYISTYTPVHIYIYIMMFMFS